MIIYFLKSTFLFLVFFLIYKGMLEKKKSLKFKRFYLLSATALGLVLPLFKVQFAVQQNIVTETKQVVLEEIRHQVVDTDFVQNISLPDSRQISFIFIVYVVFSALLLFRFLRNINKMLVLKKSGTMVKNAYGTLTLHDKIKSPFSFFDTIYLNKTLWEKGGISNAILYHEQAHVKQKHTLDIVFIEFLKVFMWFQPFLYVMKRLIQQNHEYLADEYSLSKTQNIKHYQQLILNCYNQSSTELQLGSSFHFSNLKKRFIMMQNTKKGRVWETVFYSSAVLVTYLGLVGIEAKASEIKHVETKVSKIIEHTVKEPEKALDVVVSTVSERVTEKKPEKEKIEEKIRPLDTIQEPPKIYYKNNGFSTGKITINDVKYSYVVEGDRNVIFYDDNGKKIEIKKSEYSLMDTDKREWVMSSSSNVTSKSILNKEDYTKLASPFLIKERKFTNGLVEAATKNLSEKVNEKTYFLVEFYFDIDEEGNVINVRENSNQPFPETERVKKYLYSQQKWQPSEKDGEKVLSTYKFALEIFIKYTTKEQKEFRENQKKHLN